MIKTAVITAAGKQDAFTGFQRCVDQHGVTRSVFEIIIREALDAGVKRVGVVINEGDTKRHSFLKTEFGSSLDFIEQREPLGYGHAILSARAFLGNEPFLHLVGDHVFISRGKVNCARQVLDVAEREKCAVSGVQPTREWMLPYYGVIGGKLVPGRHGLYHVETVIEKPTPTDAELHCVVPGLRSGHYLAFFGMHVLTPGVFPVLERLIVTEGKTGVPLAAALHVLAGKEKYLAYEVAGTRYDIGVKYGFLQAQLALALDGPDRDQVLTQLVELLRIAGGAGDARP